VQLQEDVPWTILDVGVDWITGMADQGERWGRAYYTGQALVDQQAADGGLRRRYTWRGAAGAAAGGVRYAVERDVARLEASGAAAAHCWRAVHRACDRITRLDLQVTVTCHTDGPDLAVEAQLSGLLRPPVVTPRFQRTLILSDDHGRTAYFGSALSDRRGRLYHKSAEQPGEWPAGTWRYEVQARHARADRQCGALAERCAVEAAILGTVRDYFTACGVQCRFGSGEPGMWPQVPARRADADRAIDWLARAVAPTICRLRAAGRLPAALMALGLAGVGIEPADGSQSGAAQRNTDHEQ
jgi:DNA relaxase NicK